MIYTLCPFFFADPIGHRRAVEWSGSQCVSNLWPWVSLTASSQKQIVWPRRAWSAVLPAAPCRKWFLAVQISPVTSLTLHHHSQFLILCLRPC